MVITDSKDDASVVYSENFKVLKREGSKVTYNLDYVLNLPGA